LREMISTALQVSIRRTNQLKGVQIASAREHDKVAKFIFAHDAPKAAEAMRKLIQGALTLFQRATR
jgi:DNA-binding FadR family transcriptional regulator